MIPSVYLASSSHTARECAELQVAWTDRVHFTSRWPYVIESQFLIESSPADMASAWRNNEADLLAANYLLVWATRPLHGALVEVGMAIALDLEILLVGSEADFGNWRHHPSVIGGGIFPSPNEALEWLLTREFSKDSANVNLPGPLSDSDIPF